MGWRFRKSMKIGPGTRLNIGSKSVGVSTGRRGFRISTNSRTGSQINASIPGTGLSYQHRLGARRRNASSNDPQGGAGWGLMGLWMLMSPSSCGCLGLIGLIVSLMILNAAFTIAGLGVRMLVAIYLGLVPLIVALGAVAIVIHYSLAASQNRQTIVGRILSGGLVVNIIYLLVAPGRFPPTAISAILAEKQAGAVVSQQTAVPTPVPVTEGTPLPINDKPTSTEKLHQASQNGVSGSGAQPVLQIVNSSFSIRPANGKRFSSSLYQDGKNIGVPTEMRRSLREIRWRIRLHNTDARRIRSMTYRLEFLDGDGQSVSRTLGLNPDDGFVPYYDKSRSAQAPVEIRSLPRLDMPMTGGQVRDVILRELVSQEAADQIRRGRISFTATWQATEKKR